jgi:hypothetical protein
LPSERSPIDVYVYCRIDRDICRNGTVLSRTIRAFDLVKIPAKSGVPVLTNIVFVGRALIEIPVCRTITCVEHLKDHWLADQSACILLIKEGILDDCFIGRLRIWVFNPANSEVTVAPQTALGTLKTCRNHYPIC